MNVYLTDILQWLSILALFGSMKLIDKQIDSLRNTVVWLLRRVTDGKELKNE